MDFDKFCYNMRREVSGFTSADRDEHSAFLIWFLENYFRLDTQEAIDSVCDHKNDKGIDGMWVDEEEETIYLFQSKFSPNDDQDQGDTDIRNFIGSKEWFKNEQSIRDLLDSTASKELKSLIKEKEIIEKTGYDLVSVFVTNKKFNLHAQEYLKVTADLESYDRDDLFQEYTFFADDQIHFPKVDLYLDNNTNIVYNLPDSTLVRVYPITAKELMKLEGIQDRTLFYKNVRYGVGNTRVNKSIRETIQKLDEHNNFFLYHNGITIICDELNEDPPNNKITIGGYAVINGCQSILTFFGNKKNLSKNLFVLVKIIKLPATSPLIKKISNYANNQNAISLKDLRSNDSVQKALQREFLQLFNNTVLYKRKKGESEDGYKEVIERDFAAQLVAAVFLDKPYNTHLKQKLFGEDYSKVYSRKINAQKVYLAYLLHNVIKDNINLISNISIRNYGLAIFFFSHAIASILREDDLGLKIIEDPTIYVTEKKDVLTKSLTKLWELITPDINFDLDEYAKEKDGFFDYKNVFKNSEFVKTMASRIKTDYIRLVRRNGHDSFSSIYNTLSENVG
ncbi:MAG: AIPR family protein [archaeon]